VLQGQWIMKKKKRKSGVKQKEKGREKKLNLISEEILEEGGSKVGSRRTHRRAGLKGKKTLGASKKKSGKG